MQLEHENWLPGFPHPPAMGFYTKIFGPSLFSTASTAIYQVGKTMLIFSQKE
jgi:hypothetical protein